MRVRPSTLVAVSFGGEEVVLCERNTFLDLEVADPSPAMRAVASMPPDFKMTALEFEFGNMSDAGDLSSLPEVMSVGETDAESLSDSEPDCLSKVMAQNADKEQPWQRDASQLSSTPALPRAGIPNEAPASTPLAAAWPYIACEQLCAQADMQSTGQVAIAYPTPPYGGWSDSARALTCGRAQLYAPTWDPTKGTLPPSLTPDLPASGYQPSPCPALPVGGGPEFAQSVQRHPPCSMWLVPAVPGTAPQSVPVPCTFQSEVANGHTRPAVGAAAQNASSAVAAAGGICGAAPAREASDERNLLAKPRAVFVDLSGLKPKK